MFCKHCGAAMEDTAQVCPSCGVARYIAQPANPAPPVAPPAYTPQQPVYTPPAPTHFLSERAEIPEENKPLSPWAYFGLQLLFAVPIVGFVFLIVFSCNGSNINRRNFARSYWCFLIVAAIFVGVMLLLGAITGGAVMNSLSRY